MKARKLVLPPPALSDMRISNENSRGQPAAAPRAYNVALSQAVPCLAKSIKPEAGIKRAQQCANSFGGGRP